MTNRKKLNTDRESNYEEERRSEELSAYLDLSASIRKSLEQQTEQEHEIDRTTISTKAIRDVFNILLVRALLLNSENPQQKISFWNAIAPTLVMKLSVISSGFFLLAATLVAVITPQIATPIVIYSLLFVGFSGCFAIIWINLWTKIFRNSHQEAKKAIGSSRDEALLLDKQTIEIILERIGSKIEVLEFVENKIFADIDDLQDSRNLAYMLLKIASVFVVVIVTYSFIILQFVIGTALVANITLLTSILAVLVMLGVVIILVIDSIVKMKMSKYKMCIYLLRQTQLVLNRQKK
jgi:hypothetical protein